MCFIEEQIISPTNSMIGVRKDLLAILERSWQEEMERTLVVTLDEECALLASLTGENGAYLARLKQFTKDVKHWSVPNALIITTSSYRIQLASMCNFGPKLKELLNSKSVKEECENFVHWFSGHELSPEIRKTIEAKMMHEFGANWQNKYFAIRSSAVMQKDSCQLFTVTSQMATYLGVCGRINSFKAIVKCWASQFCFGCIEYKREFGQQLNFPMAVIVQEMVDCDSAGVISTADPTDGDGRILTVTSNFGLGESMGSIQTDPDKSQLEVNVKANSYQMKHNVERIVNIKLGKKSLVTRLNIDVPRNHDLNCGVIHEEIIDAELLQSIANEDLIRLGNIALEVTLISINLKLNQLFFIFRSNNIWAVRRTLTGVSKTVRFLYSNPVHSHILTRPSLTTN